MRKLMVALLTGAMLMVTTSAMALTINGSTFVGGPDDLMAYTVLGNSSIQTENAWAAPLVLADGFVVNFTEQTGSTASAWTETDMAGVYAFALSGAQDYFILKTGNLYVGNPDGRPANQYDTFLYRNQTEDSWAVIDLNLLSGDNDPEYLESFQVNTGKISHFTTGGGDIPVPEPGTMMLLGVGMFGLAIFGKRRMNK